MIFSTKETKRASRTADVFNNG